MPLFQGSLQIGVLNLAHVHNWQPGITIDILKTWMELANLTNAMLPSDTKVMLDLVDQQNCSSPPPRMIILTIKWQGELVVRRELAIPNLHEKKLKEDPHVPSDTHVVHGEQKDPLKIISGHHQELGWIGVVHRLIAMRWTNDNLHTAPGSYSQTESWDRWKNSRTRSWVTIQMNFCLR